MEEFVGDAFKIAMTNHQFFTWHHVQNAHDAMACYRKVKGISFTSFSDSSTPRMKMIKYLLIVIN